MKKVDVNLRDFGRELKADFEDISGAVRRGLRESAFVLEIMVSAKTPVDEGNTRAAWRTEITPDGAIVSNDSPVVLYLEDGTRPHRPPLLPIVRWLARKEGVSSAVASLDDAPKELVGRAIAICDSIEEHGTKAHKMMSSSVPDIGPVVKTRVERLLQREQ